MPITIKKYIPSTDMNNYLDHIHHEFSDFEMATIIFNSHYPKKEILSDLKDLMEQTTDERLKAQIEEHLKYEQKKYETFIIVGDKIMYDLRVWDDDSPYAREYVHDSFYKTMSAAEQVAKSSGEKCDIVRHIETGRVGVLALPRDEQEQKEWEKRFTQNGHIDLDWTSVMINVEFLYDGAAFDHDHVSLFDLEFAKLSDDDRRKEVLLYASQLMQGNGSIQCFQMACEEYTVISFPIESLMHQF